MWWLRGWVKFLNRWLCGSMVLGFIKPIEFFQILGFQKLALKISCAPHYWNRQSHIHENMHANHVQIIILKLTCKS
jgi:hypothetical protein